MQSTVPTVRIHFNHRRLVIIPISSMVTVTAGSVMGLLFSFLSSHPWHIEPLARCSQLRSIGNDCYATTVNANSNDVEVTRTIASLSFGFQSSTRLLLGVFDRL